MNQQNVMQTLQQAVRLHQSGQVAVANELYLLVLSIAPKNTDALRLSGVASMQLGELDQAIATLEKARSLSPESPEVLNSLSLLSCPHP